MRTAPSIAILRALTAAALLLAALPGCSGEDPDDDDSATPGDDDDSAGDGLVWPNADSASNSDPWLSEHHAAIRRMEPRILALNFVNARSMEEMDEQLTAMVDLIAESSRYHGYDDPAAPAFLRPQLAYQIDLRDDPPPEGWTYHNSTLYPREDPADGSWSFDYEQLFTEEFAALMGIEDPDDPGAALDLCTLIDRGLVHEVWIYADADVPDVAAAEILELKPAYDEQRQRVDGEMNRCAGNGCFDAEDDIPCDRTVRIAWFNNTRGPGCFLESLSHGMESIGAWNHDLLPTLERDFVRFANYRLDERYGLAIDSWYSCPYGEPCLSYPSETSVTYDTGSGSGTIDPYDPVCGNVHFAPNARQHYDLTSPDTVQTSCETFGLGGETRAFDTGVFADYQTVAQDCQGPFLVYWRQSMPGLDSGAVGEGGDPILNWWVYLYY